MDGQEGSSSWQPLGQSISSSRDAHSFGFELQQAAPCIHGLPSKREIFMSTLLTRLPTYALQLLAEANESKLSCLSRLSRDDLAAVLAQPQPQLLLEAVYQQQQQQQTQNADSKRASSSDESIFGEFGDSPFPCSIVDHHNSSSSITRTENDLLPQPVPMQQRISHVSSSIVTPAASKNHLSNMLSASPVCSPLAAAAAAAQRWPCSGSSSSRRYRFLDSPVCSNCGMRGHIAEACCTPWCSTCHLWGHSEADCPNSQCWICGFYGHTFSDCPEQQQQQQQSLSLMLTEISMPETSLLLPSSFNSCSSSSPPVAADNSCLSVKSNSDARADAAVDAGSSSASSSSCQEVAHPETPPVGGSSSSGAFTAAAAAAEGSKAAAAAPARPPRAPPPRPAATATSAGSSSSSNSHKTRKYMFGGHGRGPLVCSKCGSMGHIADKCRTPKCSKCRRYGHSDSTCDSACSKCGKEHNGPDELQCTAKCCQSCGLWGHRPRNCPASQCSNCGYYGHLAAQCMACPHCKKHGHTTTKCPVTKLLGVGMYELIISD